MMMELLKRSAFVGLGLAVMSTDAVKKLGQKMADEGKLSEEEGKKLIDDLLSESEKSKSTLKKKVDDVIKDSMKEMDLATSEDIQTLNSRLDRIEALLASEK